MLISGSWYLPKNSLLQDGMHELNMLCLEGGKKPYYIRLMEKAFIDFLYDSVQDSQDPAAASSTASAFQSLHSSIVRDTQAAL